jgi:hypothetical protein
MALRYCYPKEFTPEAINRVEAAELKAGHEFEKRLTGEPPADLEPGVSVCDWDFWGVLFYISDVSLALAREACDKVRKGEWTVDRARREVTEYELSAAITAEEEKNLDRHGHKLPRLTAFSLERDRRWLRPEWERWLHGLDVWHRFENELVAIVEPVSTEPRELIAPHVPLTAPAASALPPTPSTAPAEEPESPEEPAAPTGQKKRPGPGRQPLPGSDQILPAYDRLLGRLGRLPTITEVTEETYREYADAQPETKDTLYDRVAKALERADRPTSPAKSL